MEPQATSDFYKYLFQRIEAVKLRVYNTVIHDSNYDIVVLNEYNVTIKSQAVSKNILVLEQNSTGCFLKGTINSTSPPAGSTFCVTFENVRYRNAAETTIQEGTLHVYKTSSGVFGVFKGVSGAGRHANWVEILDVRNKINIRAGHVIENIDINTAGTKFTGCHSEISLQNHIVSNPTSRYEFRNVSYDVNSGIDDASRVFEAKPVVIKADGSEIIKANNQGVSSFFPKNWDKNKILDEVEHAIANNHGKLPSKPNGNEYFGFSRDGKVEIHFYLNADGSIGSYFPVKN